MIHSKSTSGFALLGLMFFLEPQSLLTSALVAIKPNNKIRRPIYKNSFDSTTLSSSPSLCAFQCAFTALRLATDSNTANDEKDDEELKIIKGDELREATGIRPSLHPVAINAIAEALKLRATGKEVLTVSEDVQPLQVAMTAGRIAAEAIERRQTASQQDGMVLEAEEGQTIAGRVVGVIMRFDELEGMLQNKVKEVEWVAKYDQWNDFGLLNDEPAKGSPGDDVRIRIQDDPLFTMCRAECLLALFLHHVEMPQLTKAGVTVPDGSSIDFLDDDRRMVLLDN
mmetsp:Transcript_30763/g.47166  ORF Transcript_30763/g.47166 Transcript_30763/m.47166 type:complete len:283 (+) Transcript_30763:164-1012(+)|eukprot:CAMPEP_0195296920 /NCGR_PEP_ID=MMETSP0707-20130614/20408_1 /TAXON_ID=33640 /ORGANISM="Asterionellopsis glacialis, Strain CCMP134" /LENGTH=282 /DNA_ID=CAMNT_0040358555 /DNA_START=112 /DNA_END=960 /DNA_ORIENTATION=+